MVRVTKFTPHARGSTASVVAAPAVRKVYPACAGIDRVKEQFENVLKGLPRMRGDRP